MVSVVLILWSEVNNLYPVVTQACPIEIVLSFSDKSLYNKIYWNGNLFTSMYILKMFHEHLIQLPYCLSIDHSSIIHPLEH